MIALIPIVAMAAISLLFGMKAGVLAGSALSLAFHASRFGLSHVPAILFSSLRASLDISLIIFSALFMLNAAKSSGLLKRIEESIEGMRMGKREKATYILFSMVPFFEGIAGFGTPALVAAPLLHHLGFNAAASVAASLLLDAAVVGFGAVGLPVKYGIGSVSDLGTIPFLVGLLSALASIPLAAFAGKRLGLRPRSLALPWMLLFMPFILLSFLAYELATLLSGLFFFLSYPLFLGKAPRLGPWLPYLGLALLLLAFRLLSLPPYLAFLIVGASIGGRANEMWESAKRTFSAFLVLFPAVFAAKLLSQPDGGLITGLAVDEVLAPAAGMIGAFISGSNTVSNLMMGPLFAGLGETALALLAVGGAVGNAVSFFNIIAGSASVHLRRKEEVLKLTLVPALLSLALLTVAALLL